MTEPAVPVPPRQQRSVGLFGGSFDPVHVAHLSLARTALQSLALDELRWIPSGQPWQKSRDITAAAHREAMVALAIEGEPRFVLDRSEVDRPGPSYTVDTVRALQAQSPPRTHWVLIVGEDQYARLHTWHDWQALVAMVTLAVAVRPGVEPAADARVRGLPRRLIPMPPTELSASAIRERVGAGLDISRMVPPAVARYIENHRLYRANDDAGDAAAEVDTNRS